MKNNVKIVLSLFILLFMLTLIPLQTVFGYGWGYQKNNKNELPDFGKYADIVKDYAAIYADETDEKIVYFTFDNGYEQGYTTKFLDVLNKANVPATFFVTGHYVETEPELVQRMVNEGHIVGNHSYHHPDFTKMSKEEIKQELDALEKAVAQITNQKKMIYLRPPRGTFNENTLKWASELGYIHVFWSLAFKDWEINKQRGWEYAYNEIVNQIHPGAIILLHTVSEDNAEALEKVIQHLKDEGYRFGSLDDLLLKTEFNKEVLF